MVMIVAALLLAAALFSAMPVQASASWTAQSPAAGNVMINLTTFDQNNGWSRLQHNLQMVTEITIFRIIPNSDQTFRYDGSYVNVSQVIQTAHGAGVNVAATRAGT